jgi:mannose-6-phosphate isomerase-like protein (cupin superfamily)
MIRQQLLFREVDGERTPDICGIAVDLINPDTVPSARGSLAVIYIEPGRKSSRHYHKVTEEVYYFLEGFGCVVVEGEEITVEAGSAVYIPIGRVHQVSNTSPSLPLRFLSIDTPAFDVTDVFPSNGAVPA